jgi:hypothetical protein
MKVNEAHGINQTPPRGDTGNLISLPIINETIKPYP